MAQDVIYVRESKCHLLQVFSPRIEHLFGVRVRFMQNGNALNSNTQDSHDRRLSISSPTKSECHVKKAKNYVLSLIVEDSSKHEALEEFEADIFLFLMKQQDDIERSTQAVLSFLDDGQTIHIVAYNEDAVARAKSLLAERAANIATATAAMYSGPPAPRSAPPLRSPQALSSSLSAPPLSAPCTAPPNPLLVSTRVPGEKCNVEDLVAGGEEEIVNKHVLLVHTLSPGADSSHDSCYDSDSSPLGSRENSVLHLNTSHSDVSRTVSDTLGAELSEKEDAATDVSPEEQAKKVKFALKLGYTQEQLQEALDKIGIDATQNELLNELIKLSSHGEEEGEGEEEEGQEVEGTLDPHHPHHHREKIVKEGAVRKRPVEASQSLPTDTTLVKDESSNLRHIVIDGSNVAMSHGNKEVFSCKGIKLAVEWFQERGHQDITVFVPQWRKESSRPDAPIIDQEVLLELERSKVLVFTPARRVGGRRVVCYDDRYVIKLAAQTDGVVVSNDNYRDLLQETPEFRKVIEERLLMYSFVNDRFMPPDDPLGRHGPSLDNFLQKEPTVSEALPPLCPYNKKCTYGNKCKYYHPERGSQPHKSVTDKLREQATIRIREFKDKGMLDASSGENRSHKGKKALSRSGGVGGKQPLTLTRSMPSHGSGGKKALSRTRSVNTTTFSQPSSTSEHSPRMLMSVKEQDVSSAAAGSPIQVSITEPEQQISRSLSPGNRAYHIPQSQEQQVKQKYQHSPHHGQQASNLLPPDHWSLVPTTHLPMHESLRSVVSDPQRISFAASHVKDDNVLTSGHLALAKKLSDEGEPKEMRARGAGSHRGSGSPRGGHSPIEVKPDIPPAAAPSKANGHNKLSRQLSLRGSEDPRLQQFPVFKTTGNPPQDQANADWYQPQHNLQLSNLPPSLVAAGKYQHHTPLGPQTSLPIDRHQEEKDRARMAFEAAKCHQPLARMASAPVTVSFGPNKEKSHSPPAPLMTRQNSTSDPQLNCHNENLIYGDPRWKFEGSISDHHQDMNQHHMYAEDPNSGRVYQLPQNPTHIALSGKLSNPSSHPGVRTLHNKNMHPALQAHPSGGPHNAHSAYSGSTHSIHSPHGGSSHSLLSREGSPLPTPFPDLSQPPPPLPSAMPPDHHQQQHQMPVHSAPPHMAAPAPPTHFILPPPHMHPSEVMSAGGVDRSHPTMTPMDRPPPPLPPEASKRQESSRRPPPPLPKDQPISSADPRYGLYYHLCGLFAEEKVRKVMNDHPGETAAEKLCLYLISMT